MRGVDLNVPRIRIYFKVDTDMWKRNVKEVLNIAAETDVVFMGLEWWIIWYVANLFQKNSLRNKFITDEYIADYLLDTEPFI